ncbi:TPA: hypothetical protein EYP83_04605 [Candidatus Geothermarchaeota archaeon]|nr:hypothetical protein [Candidatus Geothermarchaeota archaeon]HIQ13289.1 hypothetical protein [Thermoprotei archaeon]
MSNEENLKVRMKIGDMELEIEGPPEKITKVISQIMGNISISTEYSGVDKTPTKSCKEIVEDLWREGWFSKERRLADVYRELAGRGYNFDKSAISHALASLTKEGILRRVGRERKYRYIQKYPYKQYVNE